MVMPRELALLRRAGEEALLPFGAQPLDERQIAFPAGQSMRLDQIVEREPTVQRPLPSPVLRIPGVPERSIELLVSETRHHDAIFRAERIRRRDRIVRRGVAVSDGAEQRVRVERLAVPLMSQPLPQI